MVRLRSVGDSVSSLLYKQVGRASSRVQRHRTLPVDVLESVDCYLVIFDAPAIDIDDVQVRYLDGDVTIRLKRFRQNRAGYELLFPGRAMTLRGTAPLPSENTVDPETATATLSENGTIRIEIPKTDHITTGHSSEDLPTESRDRTEAGDKSVDADQPTQPPDRVPVDD